MRIEKNPVEQIQTRVNQHFGPTRVEVEIDNEGDFVLLHEEGHAQVVTKRGFHLGGFVAVDAAIAKIDEAVSRDRDRTEKPRR